MKCIRKFGKRPDFCSGLSELKYQQYIKLVWKVAILNILFTCSCQCIDGWFGVFYLSWLQYFSSKVQDSLKFFTKKESQVRSIWYNCQCIAYAMLCHIKPWYNENQILHMTPRIVNPCMILLFKPWQDFFFVLIGVQLHQQKYFKIQLLYILG